MSRSWPRYLAPPRYLGGVRIRCLNTPCHSRGCRLQQLGTGIATPRTEHAANAQNLSYLHRDTTALLKITTLYPDEGHCLLRLEGRLADIWVEELQRQCAKELAHPRQLTLEMSGVQYLDQRAKN